LPSEGKGHTFESCRVRHFFFVLQRDMRDPTKTAVPSRVDLIFGKRQSGGNAAVFCRFSKICGLASLAIGRALAPTELPRIRKAGRHWRVRAAGGG
jgi:hypothetical protein